MSVISLEFDNTLKQSEIVMPIISSSANEYGDDYHDTGMTELSQTAVFGVYVPLIMINNTVIDFDSVKYFSLKSVGRLPELTITVEDRYELINNVDKIGQDNEVRIQILPKFDDAYKKINLTFYITNTRVHGSQIQLNAVYKLPALLSSEFKAYGKITTYELFRKIATETSLGFATNISESNDSRYVYCNNMSLLNLMDNEIQYSAAPMTIIDWWIDLWNNINLADIKERYESVDSDDDISVWVSGNSRDMTIDKVNTPEFIPAVINDHPLFGVSELYVTKYVTNVNPGAQVSKGSDKIYSIYNDNDKDCMDYLVQDGDIKSDIFMSYEYAGENIGDYNYMLSKSLRVGYFQKINSNTISVTLKSPVLGLMRGHKVNFIHYVNNDKIENKIKLLEKAGVVNRSVDSNIPLDVYETPIYENENEGDGRFALDRTVSGQYLITGVHISYTNMEWEYTLTLAKPASTNVNILNA